MLGVGIIIHTYSRLRYTWEVVTSHLYKLHEKSYHFYTICQFTNVERCDIINIESEVDTMKDIKTIKYELDKEKLTTRIVFEDNEKLFIFITYGMIFISKFDYKELSKRIDNDDLESFESYDTTDGYDYYVTSKYSQFVNESLLYLSNRLLNSL